MPPRPANNNAGPRRGAPKREDPHRINGRITAPMVRVVGEGIEPTICSVKEAIQMADEQGLDLVEISPTANPPVCKILDYKKFLFELKQKQKEMKAKAAKVVVKEIRLGPNVDEHDFNFKLKHAKEFLEDGCKVRVEVFFKGRMIVYKERGEIKLLQFAQELEEFGKVESMPKLEGKRMIMILVPKKK
ncbi:MAG: translation initiation factor IF-3 [Bacteroidales bacterium]|nr:translation initiation factor IF-3 [Bacteroidales bacterium]